MAGRRRFSIVVADSSALIALAICESLSHLEALAEQIVVPDSVYHEVVVQGKPQSEELRRFLDRRVEAVRREDFIIESGSLGQGELEAMALAKKIHADALVIDDDRARKVARFNKIPVVGSLGILLLAKKEGFTRQIAPMIEMIRGSSLFVSESLLKRALDLAGEATGPSAQDIDDP